MFARVMSRSLIVIEVPDANILVEVTLCGEYEPNRFQY